LATQSILREKEIVAMKSGWPIGVSLAVISVWIVGCGSGIDAETAAVKGKVTVAGSPMAGVQVTFTPAAGRIATGITDSSGNFSLSTFSNGDGAVPGKHKVSFAFNSASAAGGPPTAPPGMTDYGSGKMPSSAPGAAPPPVGGAAVPFNSKYTNSATSGIEVDVVAGKTNEVGPWDLTK
jgi:hypothetical protein